MRFGSLFAGIGGMDLGLERAGMQCAWQVEIDPYARRVLNKHWPDVPKWDDVRTFAREPDARERWGVDLICGGFPCQDISLAGKGRGLSGERSGLFFAFMRVVRALGPRFILLENVAALLNRGMGEVLGELAASGFDAEWEVLPAAAFGAQHFRSRVFILAYSGQMDGEALHRVDVCARLATDGDSVQVSRTRQATVTAARNEDCSRRHTADDTDDESGTPRRHLLGSRWSPEPAVDRVADGIPLELDRLGGLGNAVVPQIAEWIGRRIAAVKTG